MTVIINGRIIQYEPNLPASGMTMLGENGFLIGSEAVKLKVELQKTVLSVISHSLHAIQPYHKASKIK